MEAVKSAKRKKFEDVTIPHVEALWRTALWLTMRRSSAEELVLKTMAQAYRSWNGSVEAAGNKARLFKILAGEFLGVDYQRFQTNWFLSDRCRTIAPARIQDNGNGAASIDRQELLLLTGMPDMIVRKAVARVKPQSRLILMLLFQERFSYADIAYITGLKLESVGSIVRGLRRQVPRYLVEHVNKFETVPDRRNSFQVLGISSEDCQPEG